MLFKEMIYVYSEDHKKLINALCGQNAELELELSLFKARSIVVLIHCCVCQKHTLVTRSVSDLAIRHHPQSHPHNTPTV
jgi:hypothetical protein